MAWLARGRRGSDTREVGHVSSMPDLGTRGLNRRESGEKGQFW